MKQNWHNYDKILICIIMSKMCRNMKLESSLKKKEILTSNYLKVVKLLQRGISP